MFAIGILAFCACAGIKPSEAVAEYSARESKERLLEYLREEEGKHILSGQMDTAWNDAIDTVGRVYRDTGKYPAIKGFDFMNVRNVNDDGGGSKQTNEAVNWWNNSPVKGKNGIVTFCWHWRMPPNGVERSGRDSFRRGFAIPVKDGELDRESPQFKLILEDLGIVAAELAKLRDAGVPVLWRPLHEAAGGWFWWGADADSYKALWAYMHDYFTREKGLDNLIWVWNGQNAKWYPGPGTVDIAGYDAYESNRENANYTPNYKNGWHYYYTQLKDWAPGKIAALTENGAIPDPDALIEYGTWWAWFMTWDDHTSVEGRTSKNNHWTGEWHNNNAHKKRVYSHPFVITLDKLPAFSRPAR
jgi:mannan endo-1,4-beta-mannosidase